MWMRSRRRVTRDRCGMRSRWDDRARGTECPKSGVSVVVIVDQGHTISGATKDQASQMGQLVQQGKLRIRLARGVKPKTGLQHSKTLLVDRYLICGSTNWTMHSQKCNEISLLVRCDDAGLEAYKKRIAEIEENSEKMTTFDVYHGLVIRKEREEAKEAERPIGGKNKRKKKGSKKGKKSLSNKTPRKQQRKNNLSKKKQLKKRRR